MCAVIRNRILDCMLHDCTVHAREYGGSVHMCMHKHSHQCVQFYAISCSILCMMCDSTLDVCVCRG